MPYPHWNAFYFYISYVQPIRLTSRKASLAVASSAWHEGNIALGVVLQGPSDPLLSEQWQLSSNRIPSTWCRHRCSSNPYMRPLSIQPKPEVSPQPSAHQVSCLLRLTTSSDSSRAEGLQQEHTPRGAARKQLCFLQPAALNVALHPLDACSERYLGRIPTLTTVLQVTLLLA